MAWRGSETYLGYHNNTQTVEYISCTPGNKGFDFGVCNQLKLKLVCSATETS